MINFSFFIIFITLAAFETSGHPSGWVSDLKREDVNLKLDAYKKIYYLRMFHEKEYKDNVEIYLSELEKNFLWEGTAVYSFLHQDKDRREKFEAKFNNAVDEDWLIQFEQKLKTLSSKYDDAYFFEDLAAFYTVFCALNNYTIENFLNLEDFVPKINHILSYNKDEIYFLINVISEIKNVLAEKPEAHNYEAMFHKFSKFFSFITSADINIIKGIYEKMPHNNKCGKTKNSDNLMNLLK